LVFRGFVLFFMGFSPSRHFAFFAILWEPLAFSGAFFVPVVLSESPCLLDFIPSGMFYASTLLIKPLAFWVPFLPKRFTLP
jgi:hypothetical protein